MASDSETIRVEVEGPIARLTLNIPERHNALSNGDLELFESKLALLEKQDAIRVLVITAEGEKTFCAGAYLEQVQEGLIDANRFQRTVDRLQAFTRPTICKLNGSVYGGGVELALACDFRIGVEGTRFFVPPVKLGLCYPYTGLQRFVSRLGLSGAKRLLLANETFKADDKNELGFYDYIVSRQDLAAFSQSFAEKLSEFSPLSLQGMKASLNEIALGEGNPKLAEIREGACIQSADLQEGLLAQKEKRKPSFEGK